MPNAFIEYGYPDYAASAPAYVAIADRACRRDANGATGAEGAAGTAGAAGSDAKAASAAAAAATAAAEAALPNSAAPREPAAGDIKDPAARAELAILDSCIYDSAECGPEEMLLQMGLPADDRNLDIARALTADGVAPQRETIEYVVSVAKKISYIADNLTAELAREAAAELLEYKLSRRGIRGIDVYAHKNEAYSLLSERRAKNENNGGEESIKAREMSGYWLHARHCGLDPQSPTDKEGLRLEGRNDAGLHARHCGFDPQSPAKIKAPDIVDEDWDVDIDALYEILGRIYSSNRKASSELALPPDCKRPEDIADESVRKGCDSLGVGYEDKKTRACVRMMLAYDIPLTVKNIGAIRNLHEKIEKLRDVTPDAAATVIKNKPEKITVDMLLTAESYLKTVNVRAIGENTLAGLEGQIVRLFERNNVKWDAYSIDIAKALLRVGCGVNPENVDTIEKIMSNVETLQKNNSEEFSALLHKKGVDLGSADISLLCDLQKLLEGVARTKESGLRSRINGQGANNPKEAYIRQSIDPAPVKAVSDASLSKLEYKIIKILKNISIEPTMEMIDAGKAFIRAGVDINSANIKRFFDELDNLRSIGAAFESVEHISKRGVRVELPEVDDFIEKLKDSGKIIVRNYGKSDPRLDRIDRLIEMTGKLRVRDFGAIASLMKHDMPITLKNLAAAYASQNRRIDIELSDKAEKEPVTYKHTNVALKIEAQVKVENAAKYEAQARTEAAPEYEAQAKTADTPKVDVQTKAEAAPKIEAQAKIEDAPKIDDSPRYETQTKAEDAPKIDAQVKTVDAPKIETQTVIRTESYVGEHDVEISESEREPAVSALIENNLPVTRQSVINLYMANAAVKNVAALATDNNFITAGAYLYGKGISLENTSLFALSPLLEIAVGAINRHNANSAYQRSKQITKDNNLRTTEALTKVERSDRRGDSSKPNSQKSGSATGKAGGETGGRLGETKKNANMKLLDAHIDAKQAERKETSFGISGHDMPAMRHTRTESADAADIRDGLTEAAIGNHHSGADLQINATGGAISAEDAGNGDAARTFAMRLGESDKLNASNEAIPSGNEKYSDYSVKSFLDGLISRILNSVSQIKDIGAGRLARMLLNGAPAAADGLAAANRIAENTFSFGAGLKQLEDMLFSKTAGAESGGYGNDEAKNGGMQSEASGSILDGRADMNYDRYAYPDNFSVKPEAYGNGAQTPKSHAGASDGAECGGGGNGGGGYKDTGGNSGFGAGGSGGTNGGGPSGGMNFLGMPNDASVKSILREAALIRDALPGADLKALKDGTDITDIYNELKVRLASIADKILKMGLKQDDALAKVVSQMKDNIRVHETIGKEPAFFQIPFLYNNKPSSLMVYVYSRKRGKGAIKDGDDLNVILNLDTETLGTLDIAMKLGDKRVNLDIEVSSEPVRAYLEGKTGALGKRIRETGYSVGEISCSVKGRKSAVAGADGGGRDAAVRDPAAKGARNGAKAFKASRKAFNAGVDIKV